MTIVLGRPLVRLDNLQLQKEADLRYHLIQTRETAEAIATMGAARTVRDCLRARLDDVVANNKRIIEVTRNLGFFTNGYNYLIQLIPLLIVAPMYMQGRVEFGVVTQSAMAFSAFLSGVLADRDPVRDALVVRRGDRRGWTRSPRRSSSRGPRRPRRSRSSTTRPGSPTRASRSGRGTSIVRCSRTSSLEVVARQQPADHRAGHGRRDGPVPGDGRLLGGREGPDHPAGPRRHLLRAQAGAHHPLHPALAVARRPPPERRFADAEILAALEKVGLGPMVKRVGGLDADVHSPSALSPAEQRLLIFARVLLAAPRFVFIDRMGGELNREQIDNIYRTAPRGLDQLPEHRRQPPAGAVPRPGAGGPRRGAMGRQPGRGIRPGRRAGRRTPGHRRRRRRPVNEPCVTAAVGAG